MIRDHAIEASEPGRPPRRPILPRAREARAPSPAGPGRPSGRAAARAAGLPGLAVVAALSLTACPPRAPPPDLSLDPVELLTQVREAQARIRTVRGEASVHVSSPGGSGTVTALAAAGKPDRVYVQTLDFFGNPAVVLAAAGGVLSIYDARERVLYRGAATAENLARLVPLPISPAELGVILSGSAPLLDGRPVRADPGRGYVTLEIVAGDRSQTLRVGTGAAVERSSLRIAAGGKGSYELAFSSFEGAGGVRFPGEVRLAAEDPRVRLDLTWRDVAPNAEVGAGLFSPPVPRGARVVDLAEAPAPPGLLGEPGRE